MLADYCDGLVVSNSETLSIQPASLEQTTIRKKPGEELVSLYTHDVPKALIHVP